MNLKIRMPNDDDRIHLTFAQIAWFISIMAAILLTWGDLSSRLARIEERQMGMEAKYAALEARVDKNEARLEKIAERIGARVP